MSAGLIATALASMPATSVADSDPADPQDPATPTTVTADGMPTVQISGVVWAQAIAGDRVYAGGSFSRARPAGAPAGTNEVTRNNLLAYDLDSGNLISSFAPNLNGQVSSVAVSPDQSRLYVGGDFTTVNGQARKRIAAFDTSTGALISNFAPPVNGSVDAIVATNSTVYAGGSFLGVGNQNRSNLAAFSATNGALLNWAPTATGGIVKALALRPDGSMLAVGGSFTALNGSSNPGYGLGLVDAVTGTSEPFAANSVIRNATDDGAITTLYAGEDYLYGGGYTFGSSGGTLEGVFSAGWDGGTVHWINDCHGDTYSVFAEGDAIYQVGHSHYCENIGGFAEGGSVAPYFRGTAMSKAATGKVTWEPDQGRYHSFEGQPAPSLLNWYPSLNTGTATGQVQGPWSLAGNDDYVVMGGEFTRVNGVPQQGLVRFALKETAPNVRGPQLFGTTYPIRVDSQQSGQVRIRWGANYDQDNENLTYRVYRDDQFGAGLVHTRQQRAAFWRLPVMGFTDSGLAPGSTHRYRVAVTDSSGNIANSPWADVTVASSGSVSPYVKAVQDSEPDIYWRLGEQNGTTVADSVGWGTATARGGVSRGAAGAIAGDPNTASRFNGSSTGYASMNQIGDPSDMFTLEGWFKTTSRSGGRLVGWGNRNDRNSTKTDRQIYLDNTGHVLFGVKPNAGRVAIASGGTYRDGMWHQATATLGPNGMRLYVDGALVAQRADVTVGEHLNRGYWRIGGDTLSGWPSSPSSGFLSGDIDDVAIYRSVLSPSEIAAHHALGIGQAAPNVAPEAAFTSSVEDLSVSVDGSASSDSDGSIASYAWDFGDGGTGSGPAASHAYAEAGTYDVELTVTDDHGDSGTITKQVTVTEPPLLFAVDDFQRTVSNGLGSANVGGPWSLTGSAGTYSVSNGTGNIRTNGAGAGKAAFLSGASATDTDLSIDLALDKQPVGGAATLSVNVRRVSQNDKYNATVRYLADGTTALSLIRVVGGAETVIGSLALPGLSPGAGDRLRLRTQVIGTSPTQLRAKLWEAGSAEPTGWQLTTTDNSAALQTASPIGIEMYLGGGLTNAPVMASFDNLSATR